MLSRLCFALSCLLLSAGPCLANSDTPPLVWRRPASFDPSISGLGLPQLRGVVTETLYAPSPSKAPPEDGGSGRYESLLHGTYNHHTQVVLFEDKVVVYWTNHARDENGPGQRLLARWGTINANRDGIDWGSPETNLVELVPAPAAVRRREPLEEIKDRRYVEGHLRVVDGQLRLTGKVAIYHGWTDDLKYRTPSDPVPEERFRELRDNASGHSYDMRWDVGPNFSQLWKFEKNRLVPASPLYLDRTPPTEIRLTATRSLKLGPLNEPFASGKPLHTLPAATRALLTKRPTVAPELRGPGFAPGTKHLSADGKHGLAHMAQYRRSDGSWVVIRDNLAVPGHYYASEARGGENYPPSLETNLYGFAMPAAGQLPDGGNWILGNSKGRFDFFLTTSKDGRVFDRTWAIAHDSRYWTKGLFKPASSGPQYPFSLTIGDALWIFYSVGKEQIAATRIPFSALNERVTSLIADDFSRFRPFSDGDVRLEASALRLHRAGGATCGASVDLDAPALSEAGRGLVARFQFELELSPRDRDATLRFGFGTEPGASGQGRQAVLQPLTGTGPARVALHAGAPAALPASAPLGPVVDFARKLIVRTTYDVTLSMHRVEGNRIETRLRVFGGDMPAPVESVHLDPAGARPRFRSFAIAAEGAGMPPVRIKNVQVDAIAPGEPTRGSPADETASSVQTEAIHQHMSTY